MPGGSRSLVLGYVQFNGFIGWMDDSYLDTFPTRPAVHFIDGTPKEKGDALILAGFKFKEVEQGDSQAIKAWHEVLAQTDILPLQDDTEWEIRRAAAHKLAFELRNKKPIDPPV